MTPSQYHVAVPETLTVVLHLDEAAQFADKVSETLFPFDIAEGWAEAFEGLALELEQRVTDSEAIRRTDSLHVGTPSLARPITFGTTTVTTEVGQGSITFRANGTLSADYAVAVSDNSQSDNSLIDSTINVEAQGKFFLTLDWEITQSTSTWVSDIDHVAVSGS